MRNFQDTLETRKQRFISGFSICMTVPLWDLGSGGKLEELILGWKKNNVTSVCVIANMGKDRLDETFLARTTSTGTHWVCFLIDLTSQNVIY